MKSAIAIAAAALVIGAQAENAAAQNANASGNITLMAYAGIFQDNYTKAVVEPFLRKFPNVKITYVPGGTSAQMLGTARTQKGDPQFDVMIMDVSTAHIANTEGLFAKIGDADVPSLKELVPEAIASTPGFGPAVTFDHFVFVYNAEAVKLTSLRDLWKPEMKGQIAVDAPPNIIGLGLTAVIEKMEGGDHTKGIDKAIAKLKELAPNIQTFDPNPDGYTLILNGIVRVSTGWNARAQFFSDQSKGKLGVLLPPEGSVYQINTINVPENGKNKAAALAFVNYALSTEAQKAFTELMFYAPVNGKAEIDPKALARTAASPESRAKMVPVDWPGMARLREQWNQRWRREVLTAGR